MLLNVVFLFFSLSHFSPAEDYFVNPLICKLKKINDKKDSVFFESGFKVASIKTKNIQNCAIENGTLTLPLFGESLEKSIVTEEQNRYWLGGAWPGRPIERYGSTVFIPFGLWGASVMLNLKESRFEGSYHIDRLIGFVFKEDENENPDLLECEARRIEQPETLGDLDSQCSSQ